MKALIIALALVAATTVQAQEADLPDLSLQTLLQEAYDNSPAIAEARSAHEAARARIGHAGALPNPQVRATLFLVPIETRVGPQRLNVGVAQRFPWFGKLDTKERIAGSQADAAGALADARIRDVLVNVKLAYFELHYLARALEIVRQNRDLARHIVELGTAAFGKDEIPYFDVNRARAEMARLAYDETALLDLAEAQWRKLNALLGRVDVPAMGRLPPLPYLEMARPVDELVELALANRQEISAAARMVERTDHAIELAEKGYWPDFSVGVSWLVHEAEGPASDAGKDAFGVTVGFDVPIWRSSVGARVDEARALQRQAGFRELDLKAATRAEVADRMYDLVNAARLVRLYRTNLIPQAQAAMESAEEASRENRTLGTLLERKAVWLQFQLALQRALADYYKAVARLESVVGVPLALEAPERRQEP